MATRRRRAPRPDDGRPLSEAEWEAEFRRMDLISDRFGELLETLRDDPDRHAKISKEMGWFEDDGVEIPEDESDFQFDEDDASFDDDDDVADDDDDDLSMAFDDEDDDDGSGESPFLDRRDRADRAAVPAYAAAFDLGIRIVDLAKSFRDGDDLSDDVTTDGESDAEVFGRAFIGVNIAAAKLIGGHAMGYEDDVICGNIVKCKLALNGATDGRQAWQQLRERGLVAPAVCDDLIAGHDDVIRQIEARIADLRSRVHW